MLWKIVKSLDNVAAVQVDSVPASGVCVEVRNYKQPNTSILIYQDGKLKDVTINGCIFPCVYNHIVHYANLAENSCTFCFLDSSGEQQKIRDRRLSVSIESIFVEKFYSMLHYISYCKSVEQYGSLHRLIIKTGSSWNWVHSRRRETALEILNFIEEFTPQLSKVADTTYLQ